MLDSKDQSSIQIAQMGNNASGDEVRFAPPPVIPAHAGIQRQKPIPCRLWIPAFAGKTDVCNRLNQ